MNIFREWGTGRNAYEAWLGASLANQPLSDAKKSKANDRHEHREKRVAREA